MRVAVIGCGKQGLRHLAAFAALPAVTGLVTADRDAAAGRAAAERFGAACAPSLDAVFADPGIDAVAIATPTASHLPLAARAVASRKPFLCEKPFGGAGAEAHRVARAAAAAGVAGRVGYLYRFAPAIAAAREAIADLGQIQAACLTIAGPGDHAPWKHRRDSGGGAINELASHMVDLALWCFGPIRDGAVPEKTQLRARRTIDGIVVPVDAEDRIVARLVGGDGFPVTIEADFAAPRFAQSLQIRGAHGVVHGSIAGAPDLYRLQAQAFIDTVRGGGAGSACGLAEAADVGALLDRMRRAPMAAPVA